MDVDVEVSVFFIETNPFHWNSEILTLDVQLNSDFEIAPGSRGRRRRLHSRVQHQLPDEECFFVRGQQRPERAALEDCCPCEGAPEAR